MTEREILNVLPMGIVIIDRQFTVVYWNRWMEMYSGTKATDIHGTSLFNTYPELNRPSFLRSCRTVFTFGNIAYLSQKLHRYMFPFRLFDRNSASEVEMMQQSCTMTPIRDDQATITMIVISVQDVTDSVVLERRLRSLNHHDSLTGCFNRRFLDDRLSEEVDRHQRYSRPLSVIMTDLDHFKDVNDRYGHSEGDQALKTLCRIARAEMRASDFFCRFGGEEFVAILPETALEDARKLAERIRKRLEVTTFGAAGVTFQVTGSFGVAALSEGNIRVAQDLITVADARLYQAKTAGRNRVMSVSEEKPLDTGTA